MAEVENSEQELEFIDKAPKSKKIWFLIGIGCLVIIIGSQFAFNMIKNKIQYKKGGETLEIKQTEPVQDETPLVPVVNAFDKEKKEIQEKMHLMAQEIERQKEVIESLNKKGVTNRIKNAITSDPAVEKMLHSKSSLSIGVNDKSSNQPEKSNKNMSGSNAADEAIKQYTERLAERYSEENPNNAFLKNESQKTFQTEDAVQIENLDLKILEGKVIKGVLETAVDSDLPTTIKAHVTEDVYSEEGVNILIPNGSQLIGKYRSGAFPNGAVRVFIVWTRVKIPGGISIRLNSAGSDEIGRAGMTGNVDSHFLERFGTSILTSMLGFGAATVGVSDSDQYNSKAALRSGIAQSFSNTSQQELEKNLPRQPTIRIPQGQLLSIVVNRDLNFETVARSLSR